MSGRSLQAPWLVLAVGVMLGITVYSQFNRPPLQHPPQFLNATATHGGDTMAMATGMIEEDCEGLFVLDYLTGKLTCYPVNPRMGTFGPFPYEANVAEELGVEQGKQPKYLMVTGTMVAHAAKLQADGETRPAKSMVYVADTSTGKWVAYWLPWKKVTSFIGFPEPIKMRVFGKGSIRESEGE